MTRNQLIATAALFLTIGASATASAQDRRTRREVVVSQAEQQQRIRDQEQRAAVYRRQLAQQNRIVQQQTLALQSQSNRAAQYRYQQQYAARLAQQQRDMQAARNYSRDPYVTTPQSYRYIVGGNTRLTNQYGADALKQAVNYGYQQGFQSGQADRQDHWAASYRNSAAYRDANYGYDGNYINQSDYNYYFRQGFQRGYDDGYNSRSQYGTALNGNNSILGTVLSAILGLTQLQ